jgi:hypothetical protein
MRNNTPPRFSIGAREPAQTDGSLAGRGDRDEELIQGHKVAGFDSIAEPSVRRGESGRRRPSDSVAWAIGRLWEQGMPSDEIAAIVAAQEMQLVYRLLELHEERLEEQLMDQRRVLGRIELLLTEAIRRRRVAPNSDERRRTKRCVLTAHDRASYSGERMMAREVDSSGRCGEPTRPGRAQGAGESELAKQVTNRSGIEKRQPPSQT